MASSHYSKDLSLTKSSPATLVTDPYWRRPSSITSNGSPTSDASHRVQLIPHSRTLSHDGSLSPADVDILSNTSFDTRDVSSKDFDFEEVFTYDKPQRKLKSVVEVSSPTRDWSNYSFSHYKSALVVRQKVNKSKPSAMDSHSKIKVGSHKRWRDYRGRNNKSTFWRQVCLD